jgi:hypothetical protein
MFNLWSLFYKDESSQWEPSHKIPLWFDIQTESLNNIRISEPAENLRAFGRPDNKSPFKTGRFEYYQLGFEAETENKRIINFCFMVNDESFSGGGVTYRARYANCELTITLTNGRQLTIDRMTRRGDVEKILGIAQNKDFDPEDGKCYGSSYAQGRLSLYFSWLEDGRIEDIIVEMREL